VPVKGVRALVALLLGMLAVVTAAPTASLADSSAVRLAIVVPIVVPEGTAPLIGSAALAQYTSPNGLLTRELDAVYNRPAALAIDPLIIVSIRALGSSAPKSATAWLNRLRSASNESFALSFADSNLTLSTQAGTKAPMSVESFDFALDSANFGGAVARGPTSSADAEHTAGPVDPTLPSTADLLEWPYSSTGIAWPRENTVVSGDMKAFARAGFGTTILSSDNIVHSGTASSSVVVGSARAVVSDDAISATLRSAAAAPSTTKWKSAMAKFHRAIDASQSRYAQGATLFATFARSVPVSGSHLKETLAAIDADPNLKTVAFSAARKSAPAPASIQGRHQPAAELAVVRHVLAAAAAEKRFAAIAENPRAITSERRLRVLRLLSNQWDASAPVWRKSTSDFLTNSHDLRTSVKVVTNGSFNLLADRGSLPIAVRNNLDQEVTVFVNVRPETAILAVSNPRVKLVLEPHSQASSHVPVQAISNGTVNVDISLASASGQRIGGATTARINVQAGWETPLVVVFALLVFAVFGFGIVRRILQRRKPAND
jgi:hypothetical protein